MESSALTPYGSRLCALMSGLDAMPSEVPCAPIRASPAPQQPIGTVDEVYLRSALKLWARVWARVWARGRARAALHVYGYGEGCIYGYGEGCKMYPEVVVGCR